jgi:hypothetical protein
LTTKTLLATTKQISDLANKYAGNQQLITSLAQNLGVGDHIATVVMIGATTLDKEHWLHRTDKYNGFRGTEACQMKVANNKCNAHILEEHKDNSELAATAEFTCAYNVNLYVCEMCSIGTYQMLSRKVLVCCTCAEEHVAMHAAQIHAATEADEEAPMKV